MTGQYNPRYRLHLVKFPEERATQQMTSVVYLQMHQLHAQGSGPVVTCRPSPACQGESGPIISVIPADVV